MGSQKLIASARTDVLYLLMSPWCIGLKRSLYVYILVIPVIVNSFLHVFYMFFCCDTFVSTV